MVGLVVAAALCLLAFATTGGSALTPDTANTVSEIVLVLVAAGVGIVWLLRGGRARPRGGAALGLFGALAVLSFVSIAWSVEPAYSWVEANRTLSYFAAFAAALVLARLFPERWAAVLVGIAVASLVLSCYALLTKIFPASLDTADNLGRLLQPFGYYNATGLAAALGIPAWLWVAGARRGAVARGWQRASVAVSVPALAVLVCALIMSYGRGSVAAVVLGLALWLVLVPARLRAALFLGLGVVLGAGVSIWASAQHGLTRDYASLPSRVSAGHRFGLVIVLMLVLALVAGATAAVGVERVGVPERTRRQIGAALVALLCLVPVAFLGVLVTSSRGFGGEVSHLWSRLTSPTSGVSDNPNRLTQLGSSRPTYWRQGLKVGAHHPVAGAGAFGFATACQRYSRGCVLQAHSYVVQTFADLGGIGLALSAALLVAWILTVRVTLQRGPPSAEASEQRVGLVTMLAIAVTFGLQSAIDWTWFIPGVTVPALVCAGWVAGRGTLAAAPAPTAASRRHGVDPLRAGLALALGTVALLAAWIAWQPLRSDNADGDAITALSTGNAGTALTDARTAASADPVDWVPHEILAETYSALGDLTAARGEYVKATSVQPSNPDPWSQLASFDEAHNHPVDAERELLRVRALSPYR